ncbi:FAD/NAD(P)-binding protein [Chromohalobacter salexigens]|uniref:FAD/NAD(P)-binding protein n=1 Tax=Chromohalobacter israelensis TaxID=141390 RepID=UPI0032E917BA
MDTKKIALVGCGPWGLVTLNAFSNVLEKCVTAPKIAISIFEPNLLGAGIHDLNQGDFLFTNTLAGQVSIFGSADKEVPRDDEPSFRDWVRQQARKTKNSPFENYYSFRQDWDYLPRSMLGEYLNSSAEKILYKIKKHATIKHIPDMVMAIKLIDDSFLVWTASSETPYYFDDVIISTGHIESTYDLRSTPYQPTHSTQLDVYPTNRTMSQIKPGEDVLVEGIGLTAWDAIAELTEGRGGKYCKGVNPNELIYCPSGQEPRLHLFSRSCMPAHARAFNQKGLTGSYAPCWMTRENIQTIRAQHEHQQLDFAEDILPILKNEMTRAYCLAEFGTSNIPLNRWEEIRNNVIEMALTPRFRVEANQSLTQLKKEFIKFIERNLSEALRGNLTSGIKAATDVIRDCRGAIQEAVEFSGLTPRSHRWFLKTFVPLMNRISFGPPLFRNQQLLALLRSGVVELAGGPGGRKIVQNKQFVLESDFDDETHITYGDYFIQARLTSYHRDHHEQPLIRSLREQGLIRYFRNGDFLAGGFDVTRTGQAIGVEGDPVKGLWLVGLPCEGPRFYMHALPRYGVKSSHYQICEKLAQKILGISLPKDTVRAG